MVTAVNLDQVLENLDATSGLDGLQEIILALRDAFGIDHMVYHWVDSAGEQYGCGTYSPEWVERYTSQNYLRIDPVIQGCFQRFHPVEWKQLDWSPKAVRAFAAETLADFKVPRKVLILDELPKGATGKVVRIGLAEKLGLA